MKVSAIEVIYGFKFRTILVKGSDDYDWIDYRTNKVTLDNKEVLYTREEGDTLKVFCR